MMEKLTDDWMRVCVGWSRGVMLAGEAGMCRVVFLFSFCLFGV
nr:MAG TPA: hypothetical protein [Caudoviricetes sp.]